MPFEGAEECKRSPAGEGDSCPWEVHLELAAAGGPGAFSLSLTIAQRSPARPAAPSRVRKSWGAAGSFAWCQQVVLWLFCPRACKEISRSNEV